MSSKGGKMIFMDKKDEASISIMKIIGISLIIILIFGVTVMATEIDIRSVEITMANGYKMTVVTTKTNVAEILADNNMLKFEVFVPYSPLVHFILLVYIPYFEFLFVIFHKLLL